MLPKEILRSIPLFKNLGGEDLELIATRLHKESYPKGTIVFKEGDVGDTMYLVESGQVAVLGQDAKETIAFMGPGNFVGEISLLLAQPRTANLQIMIDAQLWALKKKDFDDLIATRPAIAVEMMRELSKRLVTTTKRKSRPLTRRITALFGADKALDLAHAIRAQLKKTVGFMPLAKSKVQSNVTLSTGVMFLNGEGLDENSLAEQLSHQVEVFKHVVVLLPEQPDPVALKAVNLANTVVSIGPPPQWLTKARPKEDIWLTSGSPEELNRTARRLTNRTVGLALSSGGSRGMAHIGVMKVLMEENIPVDLVAGTSAGAWFGAFFASGWNWERFVRFTEEIKTFNRFPNWDFNVPPRSAVMKGRVARDKIIARTVDNRRFEDLKIPLFIIAADIFTGEEVVFDSGPLADAIRSSLSLPVLVDPWQHQGRFLVDGGIVNPLPASVLRQRGADIVIASSVVQPMSESYSGRKDQMPNILQIVSNMFSAMEAEVIKKQLPLIDVLIHHSVSSKHSLDFEQVADLVRMGEETARQMLPAIKETIETPPEG